jgi:3-deoxy-D-manno-octulosonate 8-phosphate phosphatase (KDO 8-P phosphatase)
MHPLTEATSLVERCARIELLALDVDGVLTDGSITYGSDGSELKTFHVRDGSGLKLWEQAGHRAAIITGRSSPIVARRAAELGIANVVQGANDKLAAFRTVLAECRLGPEQVCYIGDDLPDLPVLRSSGLAVAVADACLEARGAAHLVTQAAGGHGAVREVIEWLLRCQGRWQELVARYQV